MLKVLYIHFCKNTWDVLTLKLHSDIRQESFHRGRKKKYKTKTAVQSWHHKVPRKRWEPLFPLIKIISVTVQGQGLHSHRWHRPERPPAHSLPVPPLPSHAWPVDQPLLCYGVHTQNSRAIKLSGNTFTKHQGKTPRAGRASGVAKEHWSSVGGASGRGGGGEVKALRSAHTSRSFHWVNAAPSTSLQNLTEFLRSESGWKHLKCSKPFKSRDEWGKQTKKAKLIMNRIKLPGKGMRVRLKAGTPERKGGAGRKNQRPTCWPFPGRSPSLDLNTVHHPSGGPRSLCA